jgi:glucan biosynthesis protein C
MIMTHGPAAGIDHIRLWSLDWIRAYAMLLGIPVHAGFIYSSGYDWFVSSPEKSGVITAITGILTSTRMPLFFFVAGLLSAINLSRRPARAWVLHRVERLGVPLVASTLVISPLVILAMARIQSGQAGEAGGYWERVVGLLQPGGQWIGHLWFLQVLLAYSLMTPIALTRLQTLKRRFLRLESDGYVLTAGTVLAAAVLVSAYRFGIHGFFHILNTRSEIYGAVGQVLQFEALFDYLPYYLLGLLSFGTKLPDLHRNLFALGFLAIAALYFADHWNGFGLTDKAIRYFFLGAMSTIATIAIFTLSQEKIGETGKITKSLIDSSFTIYLFHYPVVVWLGILFNEVDVDAITKYIVIIVLSFGLCWAVHVVVYRSRMLTFLFNGARTPARQRTFVRPGSYSRRSLSGLLLPRRGPEPR